MGTSLKSVGAVTLFVADAKRSKAFYEKVFDAPVVFEAEDGVAFKFDETILNLLELTGARELIAPAVVAPEDGGARFQLTIWVDDADAVCRELAAHGVELVNGPIDREWGVRTACFADPDGHLWEVAQPLSS